MKCPKNYLIPTNNWLKPLELLHKTSNLIMSSELTNDIKKENVVVKVTKWNQLLNTEKIYNIIKESKYVIDIYCFITCNENHNNILNEYKDVLGFCSRDIINDNNITINLEIMKKYKHTLKRYENKCNLETVKIILQYLLDIQFELFEKYGFVHNDIHLGNIIIEKCDKYLKEFNTFLPTAKELNFKLYLTDFEDSLIFKKSLFPEIELFLSNKQKLVNQNTFMQSLYNTFESCLELIDNDTMRYNIFKKYHNFGKDEFVNHVKTHVKDAEDYKKENIKQDIKPYYLKYLFNYALNNYKEDRFCYTTFIHTKNKSIEIYNYLFNIIT